MLESITPCTSSLPTTAMQIDEEKALANLVSSGIKIPPQPQVLIELRKRLETDNYTVRGLARIIGQDPGLSALLFKAVRSPVFRRNKKIENLEQVLMIIGVKQTFNLVQAAALSSTITKKSRKAFDIFWTRSNEIAKLAAIIAAERVTVCNVFPDQAYMAGIFHECGVPVLMQRFPKYCSALSLDNACCWPDLAEEDAKFDLDHCTVGYLVARHWNLPEFICAAIRYHHELPTDEIGASRALVATLQLAIHFFNRLNRAHDSLWETIGLEVLAELGLSPEDLEEYYDEISERFHEE